MTIYIPKHVWNWLENVLIIIILSIFLKPTFLELREEVFPEKHGHIYSSHFTAEAYSEPGLRLSVLVKTVNTPS